MGESKLEKLRREEHVALEEHIKAVEKYLQAREEMESKSKALSEIRDEIDIYT